MPEHPKEFLEIYTPLTEAIAELERRSKDLNLKKKIEDFFGKDFYQPMSDGNKAAYCRNAISPNQEFRYFKDIIDHTNLEPVLLEYHDKLVAKNKMKYHLAKMVFHKKTGYVNNDSVKIIDFNKSEGKNFLEVKTTWGEDLVGFHHRMLAHRFPDFNHQISNFTEWFNATRSKSDFYYFYYLSLFVYHGILFENFMVNDDEEHKFVREKVLPSIREIERVFGYKPLIVPLLPLENEHAHHWHSYDALIKDFMSI